jgi:uncharacterized membrane protein YeaQ/YmgE (transglycosylase-associated protein family)
VEVQKQNMWSNLLLLAVIGFIAGSVARGAFPGKQPMGVLIPVALGIFGAMLGGLMAQFVWPAAESPWHVPGLLMSLLGAVIVLGVYVTYMRRSRRYG